MRENDFYIFVPSDLDLWPQDLTFAPLVALVQRYVCTNFKFLRFSILEKSEARYGQKDGRGATFNVAHTESRIIMQNKKA